MFIKHFVLFSAIAYKCLADIACKYQNGKALDWFTLYKMPTVSTNANKFVKIGQAYAYVTNNTQYSNWTLSSGGINDPTSLTVQTLSAILNNDAILNQNQLGYLMYNDGLTSSSSYAHAKGVIMFDNKSIVWLIHSFPDFPSVRSPNSSIINPSQLIYGQSMLCLTLNLTDLGKILSNLLVAFPYVYDSFISASLQSNSLVQSVFKNLTSLINNINLSSKNQPTYIISNLTTKNNNQFVAFYKSRYFDADLYSTLISPQLNENVYAETWQNDPNPLNANC